jgi:hypothetical protein
LILENGYESAGFSKKDLQELQNSQAQRRVVRNLQRKKAQTKARLT